MNKNDFFSVTLSVSDWSLIHSILDDFSSHFHIKHECRMFKNGKVSHDLIKMYVRLDSLSNCILNQMMNSHD